VDIMTGLAAAAQAISITKDLRDIERDLGSGLIDQSPKMMVAAMQMADMNVWEHRS
jgi:hypothetical protein